ncbi:unnamed protein product [Diplocarpon coronariae]
MSAARPQSGTQLSALRHSIAELEFIQHSPYNISLLALIDESETSHHFHLRFPLPPSENDISSNFISISSINKKRNIREITVPESTCACDRRQRLGDSATASTPPNDRLQRPSQTPKDRGLGCHLHSPPNDRLQRPSVDRPGER